MWHPGVHLGGTQWGSPIILGHRSWLTPGVKAGMAIRIRVGQSALFPFDTQNTMPLSISSFRAPVSSVPSPTIHTHCQKPGSFVSWERSCWDVGLSGLKLGQPWANWDWWVTLELQGGRELPTHTHQETNLYCAKPPRAQDWSAEKAGDIMLMVGTPSCCLAPCLAAQVDVAVIQTAPQEQSWCGQPEDHPEREV